MKMKIDNRISRVILDVSRKIGMDVALLGRKTEEILVSSAADMPGVLHRLAGCLNFEDGVARMRIRGIQYFMLESENYHPLCVVIPAYPTRRTPLRCISHHTRCSTRYCAPRSRKPGCEEIFKAHPAGPHRSAGASGSHPGFSYIDVDAEPLRGHYPDLRGRRAKHLQRHDQAVPAQKGRRGGQPQTAMW
jgi:hypothetical protein